MNIVDPKSEPSPKSQWGGSDIDALEVAPMRDLSQHVGDPNKEIVTIRPIRPGEIPDLWTVIARRHGGRGDILADQPSRRAAFALARRFRRKLVQAEQAAGLPPRPRQIVER